MATKKIKELAELTSPADSDVMIIEDAVATKRITLQNIFNRVKAKLGAAAGYAVADNLTTSTGDSVLHAKQGKALQDTKAPNNHASTGTGYGVGNTSNYGHVMASSAAPLVAGTASAGADNGKYAREGHVHPVQTSVTGNAGTATKLVTSRRIDGVNFDGTGDIGHYVVCSTAAATAAKAVTLTGFALVTGAKIAVKFTNAIAVADSTLNVSGTGAKAIQYKGIALPANYVSDNTILELVFDGVAWGIQGDLNAENTAFKSAQYTIPTNSIAAQSGITIATVVSAPSNVVSVTVYCNGANHPLIPAGFSGSTNVNIRNTGTSAYTPPSNSWIRVTYV